MRKRERDVTIKGFDATGKVVTETVRVVPRRHWYEHAGAEALSLNAGVMLAAICMRFGRLDWWAVLLAGAIGFVCSCVTIVVASYVAAQRKLKLITSVLPKRTAPITESPVPPEHKRSR
jgi:hypothetical protein